MSYLSRLKGMRVETAQILNEGALEFGTCDLSGMDGNLVTIGLVDKLGRFHEIQVLERGRVFEEIGQAAGWL